MIPLEGVWHAVTSMQSRSTRTQSNPVEWVQHWNQASFGVPSRLSEEQVRVLQASHIWPKSRANISKTKTTRPIEKF